MKTFKALCYKEWLIAKRSMSTLLVGMGIPIIFFLFFTSLWKVDSSFSQQQVTVATVRYLMSMTAFSSLSFAFFTLPTTFSEDRQSHQLRSLKQLPIPLWQYYMVKALRVTIYFLLSIIGVFLVGIFFRGIKLELVQWIFSGILLLIGAITFFPIGILLSFITNLELMSVVSNLCYLILAAVGGLWIPVEFFPEWLQNIAKWTPTYHYNQLVISYLSQEFAYWSLYVIMGYAIVISVFMLLMRKYLVTKE